MQKGQKLILIGGGGHCHSVIDSIGIGDYEDVAIVDVYSNVGLKIGSSHIIGTDEDLCKLYDIGYTSAFISLGSLGNPKKRVKMYEQLCSYNFLIPAIIDKTAIVSTLNTKIADGAFIGKGAIVNIGTTIGKCCIINSGSIIEHDCTIGDFVHVGPGSCLSGGVTVGNNSHIGLGARLKEGINIGSNTIIGAGSVVINDIEDGVVAVGVPCKAIKSNGVV